MKRENCSDKGKNESERAHEDPGKQIPNDQH